MGERVAMKGRGGWSDATGVAMVGTRGRQIVDNGSGEFVVEHLQRQRGFNEQTIVSETCWERRRDALATDSMMSLRAQLQSEACVLFRPQGISKADDRAVSTSAEVVPRNDSSTHPWRGSPRNKRKIFVQNSRSPRPVRGCENSASNLGSRKVAGLDKTLASATRWYSTWSSLQIWSIR